MDTATDTRAPALDILAAELVPQLGHLFSLPPLERALAAVAASQRATEVLSLVRGEAINQAVAEYLPTGRRRSYSDTASALGMSIYGINAAVHRYRRWLGSRHG